MSAPGYSSLGSTANGPKQSYLQMYPSSATGYYAPPPPQNCPSKPLLSGSTHTPHYYQNSHVPPQPPPQHVGTSAPPPQAYPPAPPSQAYCSAPSTVPPSSAQYSQQSFQPQQPPYGTSGSYYRQQSYPAPLQQQPQYPLTPTPGNYPTALGSQQYSTQGPSQSSVGGVLPIQMGAPLHQYSPAQPPPGYSSTSGQQHTTVVNGQPHSTAQQSFEQGSQPSYSPHSGVESNGAQTDAPSSTGTPSASVTPSPGHQHAPQSAYRYEAHSGASEPAQSSSSSEDEDVEEEDEEAGKNMTAPDRLWR